MVFVMPGKSLMRKTLGIKRLQIEYSLKQQIKRTGMGEQGLISLKISQIRTLSVKRIRKKLARATEEELVLVIEGLNEIIGG